MNAKDIILKLIKDRDVKSKKYDLDVYSDRADVEQVMNQILSDPSISASLTPLSARLHPAFESFTLSAPSSTFDQAVSYFESKLQTAVELHALDEFSFYDELSVKIVKRHQILLEDIGVKVREQMGTVVVKGNSKQVAAA